MKHHLELLGFNVSDKVTGFKGVVSSISFDLYGCVQANVTPGLDKEGKLLGGYWFDTNRLKKMGNKPVMKVPTFELIPGGQILPEFNSQPSK